MAVREAILSPLVAYEALEAYAGRHGWAALELAMHAAVPESLRVDMVALLRRNFLPAEHALRTDLDADLLFASFCEHLGGEYFRLDPEVRRQLVEHLADTHLDEARPRIRRVAAFLLAYVDHLERRAYVRQDRLLGAYLETQRWVALAFLEPDTAAEQLAGALEQVAARPASGARLRLGSVASVLSLPLAHYRPLLDYAFGVAAIDEGDRASAEYLLGALGDASVGVGSHSLPAPNDVLRRAWPSEEAKPTPEPTGAAVERPTDADWWNEARRRVGRLRDAFEELVGQMELKESEHLEGIFGELQDILAAEAEVDRGRLTAGLEELESQVRRLEQVRGDYQRLRATLEAHALWLESGGTRGARANLGDIALENLELEDARLEEAVLDGARLPNAHLPGVRLKGASLRGTDLSGADLTSADLAEARLEKTSLEGANLTGASLQRARLEGTNLRRALLKDAVLESAELAHTDLRNASLAGANLRFATLTDVAVAGADFSGADLSQASLDEVDLRRARLEGAPLGGVALERVRLTDEQQELLDAAPVTEFDVFVSFAEQDGERIRPILKLVSEAGYSVFADRSILGREQPWQERWEQTFRSALSLLVCLTEAALSSEWLPRVAQAGAQRGVLITLVLDKVPIPSAEALASGPLIELVDWRGEPDHPGLRRLLDAVAKVTRKTPVVTARADSSEVESETVTPDLEPGTIYRERLADASEGPEMVVIPAGEFWMGSDKSRDPEAFDDELPHHRVSIARRFALGRYPVTFAEYDSFAEANGRKPSEDRGWGRENRPVINVSWEDAVAYCAWLSEQSGRPYRLPTEAEWEYAARAGTETRYWWGEEAGKNNANCDGCGSEWDTKQTAPVGSFRPNNWGLHDMLGNVWEWVQDCWHRSYEGAPTDGSAWEEGDCARRVVRGGSWEVNPGNLRSPSRARGWPGNRDDNIGFRLAQDL
jgi:formylglycine-generating enzyme required for sulfatase activity/uncharacterized protein YjbI with pentapeptide repeats